nr:unnamed protein product [Callosobruchus analis]CAI5845687.1 unnamed protein product [Callosobruchus analis]CAI5863027.1 unnamed protein product [Callosobruchus analis]
MKIKPAGPKLPVVNYDAPAQEGVFRKHGSLFGGESKRALIVGASGSGKTNIMISLITHPNGLRFSNIYIYCKSPYQPKYRYLRKVLEPLKEIGYFEYTDDKNIVPPNLIKPNSLIIFDDVASCSQDIIRQYYSFGRHRNTDCFYLCQTYTAIPKHLLRDNATLLIVLPQDILNLKHIYEDHCSMDMTFQEFKQMCGLCWQKPYDFLVIDKDSPKEEGRYRQGFDKYIYF